MEHHLSPHTTTEPLGTDHGYHLFEMLVARRVSQLKNPLFTIDEPEDLWEIYLDNIGRTWRQHYNCNRCRDFITRYGGLVQLDDRGNPTSALWGNGLEHQAPAFFQPVVQSLEAVVNNSRVTGVFYTAEKVWGIPSNTSPKTGIVWTHLYGDFGYAAPPEACRILTPEQAMSAKKQDYIMLKQALKEYPAAALLEAQRVLQADALYRGEKTLGLAEWLVQLRERLDAAKPGRRDNVFWQAAAVAPPGFCHVRSGMIGTLLDDIVAGYSYEVVAARWAKKMHPLQYQRPTAAPKEGTIKQAEEVFAKLNAGAALQRRFAKVEEITAIWQPGQAAIVEAAPGGGLFGHLKGKGKQEVTPLNLPAKDISWEKFLLTVVKPQPSPVSMDVRVPVGSAAFFALVTAADPAAPPILQWDTDPRNPFSWYFYAGGSVASQWNLAAGLWAPVTALAFFPHLWHHPDKFGHQAEGGLFVLAGCRDLRYQSSGGLFPECLRSEYHGVRSVIEAHVGKAVIAGKEEATACGLAFQKPSGNRKPDEVVVRVSRGNNAVEVYRINRWD